MTDRLDMAAMFVAVAELESFAAAARRLNRTPAAVTRAVAALEDQLQTRLLNRTTRSVALTEEGARIYDACRRLLAAFEEVRGLEGRDTADPQGVITVTAPVMFGGLHVLPAVCRFLVLYPQVSIQTLFVDRVVPLVEERHDVGVRLGELPDSSLRAMRAGAVTLGVYASPDYLARCGTPKVPQDLAHHATISCVAIALPPERWIFRSQAREETVAISPRLIVNLTAAAADAAASGLGLTYIVSYQAEAHVRAGRLVRVLNEFAGTTIPIHIVQPPGRFLPARVRLLIDFLAADFRQRFGED